MQNTNPKEILNVIHQLRAGLSTGLLKKEEVIDWADQIVTKDNAPDVFFIDLLLAGSRSIKDITHYIGNYLNFETPTASGRPLLGLLFKRFIGKKLTLHQTIIILYELKNQTVLSNWEESFVYSIDDGYDLARNSIYGTIQDIHNQIEIFLGNYAEYTLDNYQRWSELDKQLEENHIKNEQFNSGRVEVQQEQQTAIYRKLKRNKKWWKFW
jgi:hypothetical protein